MGRVTPDPVWYSPNEWRKRHACLPILEDTRRSALVRCAYCAREQERPASGGCVGCGASNFVECHAHDWMNVTTHDDRQQRYLCVCGETKEC